MEADFLKHLRSIHLRANENIQCPHRGCTFQTRVYATSSSHKSKTHSEHDRRMLKPKIISGNSEENDNDELEPVSLDEIEDNEDLLDNESSDFEIQLEHNLAGIFLKMQSILHIPASSVHDILK